MRVKDTRTILLTEDNQAVRFSVGELLRLRGYNVYLAADGLEALEIVTKSKEPVDLLITDIILPKMNGVKLAEKLLQQQSTIKILFMSGYSEQTVSEKFEHLRPLADFIQKPCSMNFLLQKIRSLLNETEDESK